jgi:transitional endoplasmic reticulum ATPase
MNDILNTIDGVDMKRAEQIVVLTTNHVDRINRAMLRPGRLDAVISVLPPDAQAVTQLMRHYARGLLNDATDESLQSAAKLLEGQIPSIVREVVERSKLAAVFRVGKGGDVTLVGEDLTVAAKGMLAHMKLLEEPKVDDRSDMEKAAALLVTGFQPSAPAQRIVPTVPVALSNGDTVRAEV